MIVNRLNYFFETHKEVSDLQAGCRKKRNTIDQAAFLSQSIKDGFHYKRFTLPVYVDFKCAYDTIWIEKLNKKGTNMGIFGCMFKRIKSFFS